MEFARLKQVLTPHFARCDTGSRLDHAQRLAARAVSLCRASAATDWDEDTVKTLSLILPVRESVRTQAATRSAVEACLVEAGWPPLRIRETLRAIERLPD
jgi:hypothetical protein